MHVFAYHKKMMNTLASFVIFVACTTGFTIFGTTSANGQVRSAMECPGWGGLNINATEATIFRVTIGTSGGARGYPSITGLSGSEIAYYINDTMIPVLRLRRGVTYTFIVEAGNDPNDVPNYHPFYITDSEDGGILLDTAEEKMRKNEQVFAGFDLDTSRPTVTAAGRLCEHIETDESAAVSAECTSQLQDYLNTLNVACKRNETNAAILSWTPDANTPNIVYYQSANNIHLGWKIVFDDEPIASGSGLDESVTDSPDEPTGSGIDPPTSSTRTETINPTGTVTVNPTNTETIDPTDTVTIDPTDAVTTDTVPTDPDEPTSSTTNSNSGNQANASGSQLIILMFLVLTLQVLMN